MKICPLCYSEHVLFCCEGESREYYSCENCDLVFVPEEFHLAASVEKEMYEHHENNPEDLVYQNYLKQIMNPVVQRVVKGAKGLDFGCGPGPALSQMFELEGYQMDIYDAYFACDDRVFSKSYDFITVCEAVEHFCDPRMELDRLFSMLKPGGVLVIKMQLLPVDGAFCDWYYKRDRTHVCFFSVKSLSYLAEKWKAELEFVQSDVFLFKKSVSV